MEVPTVLSDMAPMQVPAKTVVRPEDTSKRRGKKSRKGNRSETPGTVLSSLIEDDG